MSAIVSLAGGLPRPNQRLRNGWRIAAACTGPALGFLAMIWVFCVAPLASGDTGAVAFGMMHVYVGGLPLGVSFIVTTLASAVGSYFFTRPFI
jgi:hypothetical protein